MEFNIFYIITYFKIIWKKLKWVYYLALYFKIFLFLFNIFLKFEIQILNTKNIRMPFYEFILFWSQNSKSIFKKEDLDCLRNTSSYIWKHEKESESRILNLCKSVTILFWESKIKETINYLHFIEKLIKNKFITHNFSWSINILLNFLFLIIS